MWSKLVAQLRLLYLPQQPHGGCHPMLWRRGFKGVAAYDRQRWLSLSMSSWPCSRILPSRNLAYQLDTTVQPWPATISTWNNPVPAAYMSARNDRFLLAARCLLPAADSSSALAYEGRSRRPQRLAQHPAALWRQSRLPTAQNR